MTKSVPLLVALALLAACGAPRLDDPRTNVFINLSGPQHYAGRILAQQMAGQCPRYTYLDDLADAMSNGRRKAGLDNSLRVRGAANLEADVWRRSLIARHGTTDACTILDGETAAQTPLSVLVLKKG